MIKRLASFGLILLVLVICDALPCQCQQNYQFVPGSRQAVPVDQKKQQQQMPDTFNYSGGGMSRRAPAVVPSQYNQNPNASSRQPAIQPQSRQQSQSRQQQPGQQSARSQPEGRPSGQAGKSNKGSKAYDFTDVVNVDGMKRSFIVHIPSSYDRTKAVPVLLVFHGVGMTGAMMIPVTGFNGLSDRNNFVVVYGDGVGHKWQDGRTGNADDVSYVGAILTRLPQIVNVDSRRIYACGISNGGFFTQLLACALSDRIAAVGVVASTMMDQASTGCGSGRPMPIAFFLGTEDPLIPWGDGRVKDLGKLGETLGLSSIGSIDGSLARIGGVLNVREMMDFWTAHNGCSLQPRTAYEADVDPRDGTRVKKESYGSGSNEVILYTIEGGGHTWPGCFAFPSMTGRITRDIVASDLLWEFFSQHSR